MTGGCSLPQQAVGGWPEEASAGWVSGPDQSFMAAVLNNLSDALVACNAQGILFNPAARQLHGMPAVPLPPEQWAQYYDLFLADGTTPMLLHEVPLGPLRRQARRHVGAITEQAGGVIGAEQSVVSLTPGDDWSQAINAVVMGGEYALWVTHAGVTDGSGIYALVCETNAPIRLTQEQLEEHPRWRGFGAHAVEHPPMRGWLAAPLVRPDGSNLGLVQLSDKTGVTRAGCRAEFDETDLEALVQLAQVASLALEKAVEFEREHEVAVEL